MRSVKLITLAVYDTDHFEGSWADFFKARGSMAGAPIGLEDVFRQLQYLCGVNDGGIPRHAGRSGIQRVLKCDWLPPSFHGKVIVLS